MLSMGCKWYHANKTISLNAPTAPSKCYHLGSKDQKARGKQNKWNNYYAPLHVGEWWYTNEPCWVTNCEEIPPALIDQSWCCCSKRHSSSMDRIWNDDRRQGKEESVEHRSMECWGVVKILLVFCFFFGCHWAPSPRVTAEINSDWAATRSAQQQVPWYTT